MKVIISDTSVITNLIHLNLIDLLEELFTEIIITNSVEKELASIQSQSKLIKNKPWIKTVSIKNFQLLDTLLRHLDYGEAESIVLSIEMNADLLLMMKRKDAELQWNMV